jgi:cytochrome c biogenesis protein ResB
VNDPLSYKGYSFYQSNYRKEDPTYSGILVVRDPGLPVVWAGFVMVCAGVIFAFYARPRILERRSGHVS